MKILCKIKDFYDYATYIYGKSDFPVYDRRENTKLTDTRIIQELVPNQYNIRRFSWDYYRDGRFALIVGRDVYFIKVDKWEYLDEKSTYATAENLFKNVKYIVEAYRQNFFENDIPYPDSPLTLTRASIQAPNGLNWRAAMKVKDDWNLCKESELSWLGLTKKHWSGAIGINWVVKNPILSETGLTAILDPQKIATAIENYLSSLYNDKPQESTNPELTDVDKAVNKGFDKKESFRSVK